MGSEAINNKFQRHLLEDANLIYGEFLNDLAKLMVNQQEEFLFSFISLKLSYNDLSLDMGLYE